MSLKWPHFKCVSVFSETIEKCDLPDISVILWAFEGGCYGNGWNILDSEGRQLLQAFTSGRPEQKFTVAMDSSASRMVCGMSSSAVAHCLSGQRREAYYGLEPFNTASSILYVRSLMKGRYFPSFLSNWRTLLNNKPQESRDPAGLKASRSPPRNDEHYGSFLWKLFVPVPDQSIPLFFYRGPYMNKEAQAGLQCREEKGSSDIMMGPSRGGQLLSHCTISIVECASEQHNYNNAFLRRHCRLFNGFWKNALSRMSSEIVFPSAPPSPRPDHVVCSLLGPAPVRRRSPAGLHSSGPAHWKLNMNLKCLCCIVLICRGDNRFGSPAGTKEEPASS